METFVAFWPVLITVGLIVLGISVGGMNERAHLKRLDERERVLSHITVNNLKRVTRPDEASSSRLVMGQVVIATDYFKSFVTGLRNLVGGEMHAAQSLMIRGRREALVRLLQEADALGAHEVWDVRFGFSSISQMRGGKGGGAMQVEIVAWGTAVVRDPMRAARLGEAA